MKKNLIYILLIGTLISSDCVFAEKTNFKERTEQWLQHSEKNLRGDGNGGEENDGWISPGTTPEDPEGLNDVPVGDFLPLLAGFSLIYGFYISGKKKKKVSGQPLQN
jgi:hypothetical protein